MRHVLALRAAASHRGDLCGSHGRQDGTQPVKPESKQRTQRQMTLRLILPLLVLAGVVFVLVILLFGVLDFFFWIEIFHRGFA